METRGTIFQGILGSRFDLGAFEQGGNLIGEIGENEEDRRYNADTTHRDTYRRELIGKVTPAPPESQAAGAQKGGLCS